MSWNGQSSAWWSSQMFYWSGGLFWAHSSILSVPRHATPPKSLPSFFKIKSIQSRGRFWYPMDLRVSGKDLIQNHLTMA